MGARGRAAVCVAWAALSAAGCGLVSFDVSQDIPQQTVQGSPLGALLPAGLFNIPMMINIDSETQGRGTGPARSANLKSITLTVTAPDGGNFDFVDSIAISISASGQADREIARTTSVPKWQKTISIPPTPGVDLLPYIKAGANISASGSGHLPSQTTTYNGRVTVTVHV